MNKSKELSEHEILKTAAKVAKAICDDDICRVMDYGAFISVVVMELFREDEDE